ncbi:MAG: hypothetical protein GY943_30075 [Chloroflexi bacterium]|nr:hypothetical protein [Chloroflexota bacterium]
MYISRKSLYFLCLIVLVACTKLAREEKENLMESGDCISSGTNSELTSIGYTWKQITIGVSTKEDVIEQFGEPKFIRTQTPQPSLPSVCWYVYDEANFWIDNETVIGIQLPAFGKYAQENDFPINIIILKESYGKPDIVGWSSTLGPNYRVLVWLNQGIEVDVFVGDDNPRITSVLHFGSITVETFYNSPFVQLVSGTRPVNTDEIDPLPKDPFNWDEN